MDYLNKISMAELFNINLTCGAVHDEEEKELKKLRENN